ncbi:universal stress protein [Commensalibacter oyaizuii]|uniref:Universal stress protein n=1 Tax=Commensalibacter oyaizuii TaxID=3043873 RepID=A0ABT6Q2L7_9PROT|nr:universal stress protein [Commensalibacter sp. TBRC 16381]MDI2091372.1 universal stress protein [Commensalibacter sp. TBRC 16381]
MNHTKIVTCIDQSDISAHVTDYAAWIATNLHKPLELFHIVDQHPSHIKNINPKTIDVQENYSQKLLETYHQRALDIGLNHSLIKIHEEEGNFLEKIIQYEPNIDLLVIGRRGEQTEKQQNVIGNNIQQIIRSIHRPILSVAGSFSPPKNSMIAFSGSKTSQNLINQMAEKQLFLSLPLYLVMSGKQNDDRQELLAWAHQTLEDVGYNVTSSFIVGGSNIEDTIVRTVQEQCIDILIMGAFSHTSLYNMIFGSKTVDLLRYLNIPILHLH